MKTTQGEIEKDLCHCHCETNKIYDIHKGRGSDCEEPYCKHCSPVINHIPLSECECMECMKDEYCQACEDFGHQKEEEENV